MPSGTDTPKVSPAQIALIWLPMLLVSDFGSILCHLLLGIDPPGWVGFVNLGLLGLLVALSWPSATLRPLRGYFLALMALAVGYALAGPVAAAFRWEDWRARMLGTTVIHAVIPCGLLALSLVGSGFTRQEVYLAKGDMAAPCRMPGRLPDVSWAWLGPVLMIVLAGGLAVQLVFTVHPDRHMAGRALLSLPMALAFAAINAAQEEFRYRAVLLARLVPLVGATQALFVTSMMFGLDHWFGHPSGPTGVLLAGFAGYLWGRSMIETRGSAWAWLIHAFQDVVIVLFIAAAKA